MVWRPHGNARNTPDRIPVTIRLAGAPFRVSLRGGVRTAMETVRFPKGPLSARADISLRAD